MSISRFTAGALMGFAAGLLLAPEKGEKTRQNLSESADRLCDGFNRLVGRATTRLDDLRDYLEQDIEGLPEDVRKRILIILDEAEEMAYDPGAGISPVSNGVI